MIAKDGVSDDTVSCAEILQMRRLLILRPHNLITGSHYCHYQPPTPTPAPIPTYKADVFQVNQYGDICFGLVCLIIVYSLIAKKVLFTFQKILCNPTLVYFYSCICGAFYNRQLSTTGKEGERIL